MNNSDDSCRPKALAAVLGGVSTHRFAPGTAL